MKKAQIPYISQEILEDVKRPLLAAVDLGSTSIVTYLMDGLTGRQLSVRSMQNPQKKYGADVVTRSSYALEHGAGILSGCAAEAVNHLLREEAKSPKGRHPNPGNAAEAARISSALLWQEIHACTISFSIFRRTLWWWRPMNRR